MLFMLFILFSAFDVVVQRTRRPGNHIDRITSRRPLIHGTWHIRLTASFSTAAGIAPAAASSLFAPSSMTTKPIRFNHCCAHGGVFVVLFVVDDEDDTNSFNFSPAAASLSFSLLSMTKTIRIHSCCTSSGVFVVCSVVNDDEVDTIQPCCAFSGVFVIRSVVDDDEADMIQSCCAFSGVFVVRSVVDDDEADTIQPYCAFSGIFVVRSIVDDYEADTIQSCWQPTWSYFHSIAAVRRSNPIDIDSLTLIVVCSALGIHRALALIISNVPPYALLWV